MILPPTCIDRRLVGQVGGYLATDKELLFATVRAAGHMVRIRGWAYLWLGYMSLLGIVTECRHQCIYFRQVPYTQPERAQFLVRYFIEGRQLPK
jgi:hypothetical protein